MHLPFVQAGLKLSGIQKWAQGGNVASSCLGSLAWKFLYVGFIFNKAVRAYFLSTCVCVKMYLFNFKQKINLWVCERRIPDLMCGAVWGRARGLHIAWWFWERGLLKWPAVAASNARLGEPAARSSPQVWSARYPSLPLKERVRTQRLQERPAPDRSRAEDAWGFLATALGGGSLLLAAPGPPFCASPPCSLLSSETTACHPPGQLLIVFQRNISSSLTRLSRQQHMMEWA